MMARTGCGQLVLCTLLACMALASTAAFAAGADYAQWALDIGGESGEDSSRAASGALSYDTGSSNRGTRWGASVSALRAQGDDAGGTTLETTSSAAAIRFGNDVVGGSMEFDSTRDEDLRKSRRWTGTLSLSSSGWRAAVNLSTRHTDFDSFDFSSTSAGRIGQVITISGVATCSLHDLGYGGTVGYDAAKWSVYASGTVYDYDDAECEFDVDVPESLRRLNRDRFSRFADTFLARAASRAGGSMGQSSGLLDQSFGAGIARYWATNSLSFDYAHTTDEFGGATQGNYSLTASHDFTLAFAMRIFVGTTDDEANGAVPYGGLYATMRW